MNLPRSHIRTSRGYYQRLRNKFYRRRTDDFGLYEALWWPHVDIWLRYVSVLSSLAQFADTEVSILDVGGGENIASWFFTSLRMNLVTIDIDEGSIRTNRGRRDIDSFVGDGRLLPFKDSSFDAVLSIGSLEHVPVGERDHYLEELKRVSRAKVVVWTPVEEKPAYLAKETDLTFNAEHRRRYGFDEKNTAEHIASGDWVSLTLLKRHFPGATFTGQHNCEMWLKHMQLSQRPDPLMFLTGPMYLFALKKYDGNPPFFACKVDYDKEAGKSVRAVPT